MAKQPIPTKKTYAKQDSTVRLYPRGEALIKKVDSIKSANPALGKRIGSPMSSPGVKPQYGTNSSDMIKQALKPKKK